MDNIHDTDAAVCNLHGASRWEATDWLDIRTVFTSYERHDGRDAKNKSEQHFFSSTTELKK